MFRQWMEFWNKFPKKFRKVEYAEFLGDAFHKCIFFDPLSIISPECLKDALCIIVGDLNELDSNTKKDVDIVRELIRETDNLSKLPSEATCQTCDEES